MVQLTKHTYYGAAPAEKRGEFDEALFEPSRSSAIVKQITSKSVAVLLDMWCLPLRSRATRWLWDKPMPCYDTTMSGSPAGGNALVTVLSQAFVEWEGNMNDTKRILMPQGPAPSDIRWKPYSFYPETAAHLSQSDFNILFPWLMARALKTKDPERLLKLNVRAILQVLRNNNVEVGPTSRADIEGDGIPQAEPLKSSSQESLDLHDTQILDPEGEIPGWIPISMEAPGTRHTEEDYQTPAMELEEGQALAVSADSS